MIRGIAGAARAVVAVACASVLGVRVAVAQGEARGVEGRLGVARRLSSAAPSASRARAAEKELVTTRDRRPSMVVEGAPQSIRVIAVSLPEELREEAELQYEVITSGARLLSARSGVVRQTRDRTQLLITVQFPADASAGRALLAEVIFTGRTRRVITPVDVDVAVRARTRLATTQRIYGTGEGQRVMLGYVVMNAGNAPDSLDLRLAVPERWIGDGLAKRRVILAPGAADTVIARVRPPSGLSSGDAAVTLVVSSRGVERARTDAVVRVASYAVRPRANLSVVTAVQSVSDGVGTQSGLTADVRGALTPSIHLDAHLATELRRAVSPDGALPLMAYGASQHHVALAGQDWSIRAGASALQTSELTGLSMSGTGVAAQFRRSGLVVRGLAAETFGGAAAGRSPRVAYASVGHDGAASGLALAVGRIENDGRSTRGLDALALSGWLAPSRELRVAGEMAERRFDGGRGLGLAVSTTLTAPGSDFAMHFVRAPGGSAASASGTQSMFLHLAQLLPGHVRLSADGWFNADSTSWESQTRSSGWSLTNGITLGRFLEAELDVRALNYRSSFVSSSLENAQRQIGVRLRSAVEALSVQGQLSRVDERRTLGVNELSVDEEATRMLARVEASYAFAWANLRTSWSYASPIAWAGAQRTLGLGVDGLHPIPGWRGLSASASHEVLQAGSDAMLISRLAATAVIGEGMRAQLTYERSGVARSDLAAPRGMFFLKIEKATGWALPSADRAGRGIVFRDLNGNGFRDPGEPGFEGVVVRRGAQSAVTDAAGRYVLGAESDGPASVDERSLPSGWAVGRAPVWRAGALVDIPIAPTGRVTVAVVTTAEPFAGRAVHLGTVAVQLTDSTGRSWMVRTATNGRAYFDALPLGRYTVKAEADEASEPLILTVREPIVLGPTSAAREFVIEAQPRPMRVFQRSKGAPQ